MITRTATCDRAIAKPSRPLRLCRQRTIATGTILSRPRIDNPFLYRKGSRDVRMALRRLIDEADKASHAIVPFKSLFHDRGKSLAEQDPRTYIDSDVLVGWQMKARATMMGGRRWPPICTSCWRRAQVLGQTRGCMQGLPLAAFAARWKRYRSGRRIVSGRSTRGWLSSNRPSAPA